MNSFANSERLYETSKNYLAGGVSSNLRLAMKPVPIFVKEAKGARMIDEDNNEYIDYILAYGPQILGHSHPAVVEAIKKQVEKGQTFGAQHQGEIELAKKVCEYVPCVDQVSYCSTGSEAVQLAIRLARAFTGRKKIVRFDGHYHGWMDTISTSSTADANEFSYKNPKVVPGTLGQSENALKDVIILPWNDPEALENVIEKFGQEIAGIITEPIMCNSGCISPETGYLEKMRELATRHGIVLIFDEVITGFRLGLGGAQEELNITPDLVTLGKAVAGGLPLSVVGGKKEIMDLISNNEVVHMGTLNGNPLCVSAALASINFLSEKDGEVYGKMKDLVNTLVENMKSLARNFNIPLLINNQGTVFHTMFTSYEKVDHFYKFQQRDSLLFSKFAESLLKEGIAVRPSGLWYISTAHRPDDIERTLEKIEKCFRSLMIEIEQ